MVEEYEVEKKTGRDILFKNKNQTDVNYDSLSLKTMEFLNENGKLILATHNNESIYSAMEHIEYQETDEKKNYLQD